MATVRRASTGAAKDASQYAEPMKLLARWLVRMNLAATKPASESSLDLPPQPKAPLDRDEARESDETRA
ncbi:MAG: hypothetical protein ACREAA_02820 [Candidatus Polarisedimenticolia bacterium]